MTIEPSGSADRRIARDRLLQHSVVAEPLKDLQQLYDMGLLDKAAGGNQDTPVPVVVELNLRYKSGITEAAKAVDELLKSVTDGRARPSKPVSDIYIRVYLSMNDVQKLVHADTVVDEISDGEARAKSLIERTIYRIWPDFPVEPLIYRSVSTIKADAAQRSFAASGKNIVWAVIDSGIDACHPHFKSLETLSGEEVNLLHRDFAAAHATTEESAAAALTDDFGHGTHVAGIIAGRLHEEGELPDFRIYEETKSDTNSDVDATGRIEDRTEEARKDVEWLAGVAPLTKLVSLKVLDQNGRGSSMTIVEALQHIRTEVNGSSSKLPRIHGVNLSIGHKAARIPAGLLPSHRAAWARRRPRFAGRADTGRPRRDDSTGHHRYCGREHATAPPCDARHRRKLGQHALTFSTPARFHPCPAVLGWATVQPEHAGHALATSWTSPTSRVPTAPLARSATDRDLPGCALPSHGSSPFTSIRPPIARRRARPQHGPAIAVTARPSISSDRTARWPEISLATRTHHARASSGSAVTDTATW